MFQKPRFPNFMILEQRFCEIWVLQHFPGLRFYGRYAQKWTCPKWLQLAKNIFPSFMIVDKRFFAICVLKHFLGDAVLWEIRPKWTYSKMVWNIHWYPFKTFLGQIWCSCNFICRRYAFCNIFRGNFSVGPRRSFRLNSLIFELSLAYSKLWHTDKQIDRQTDGRTDGHVSETIISTNLLYPFQFWLKGIKTNK